MGNGVEVLGGREYHLDPLRLDHGALYCISHAHSDHLPKEVRCNDVMCSPLTLKAANGRLGESLLSNLNSVEHPGVSMIPAGHIPGSMMFHLEDEGVLYTGDFSPRDRFGISGARPRKTDILVMEATFGRPRYVFPPSEVVAKDLRDWVEDIMAKGDPVAIYAYPLGKCQELLRIFDDLEPYLHGSMVRTTGWVEEFEGTMNYRPYERTSMRSPFLLICPPQGRRSKFIDPWRKKGIKTAAVSGWAIDTSYRYMMNVDETFPLSDHADFEELLSFVKDCDPERVHTLHGFNTDLAAEVRSRLDIEAIPLMKGNRTLLEF